MLETTDWSDVGYDVEGYSPLYRCDCRGCTSEGYYPPEDQCLYVEGED